ncbi:MAG: tetratricopeptide repeat protein [Phycisphaerae bacterium]|nr:tetratricopeptide repeat protein [Saprospiraceae bacterium]
MKNIVFCLALTAASASAQNAAPPSQMDPLSFGVVLDHPGMKDVVLRPDVNFLKDEKSSLNMDIYQPPGLKPSEKRPAIIFLNAIGERSGEQRVKSWGIYSTWPRLMAAQGFVGISMESDGGRIQETIQGLFDFIKKHGNQYNIDTERLGVYAASANVTQSTQYLMSQTAFPGIKAAVLYYGGTPEGPYRKDLPVLFVVSEGDVARNGYGNLWSEVLKNNAPWTIKMGTGMPHAFDAYSDNDAARRIVLETISFWKNNLDPVPQPAWKPSKVREILGSLQMERPKAVILLKSLSDEYPQDLTVLSFYAEALGGENRYAEAEAVCRKMLTQQPENREAIRGLIRAAFMQNKTVEAERLLSEATKSGQLTRQDCSNMGYTLLVAGKDREGAKLYEAALAIAPGGLEFYNLACAYAKVNETDRAIAALENAIKLGNTSKRQIESDPDLNSLKEDKRFKAILENLK